MRILAIQLNQPGDAILTTPALRWLMQQGHEIHALLQPLGAELLRAMPGLASVEALPRKSIQLMRDWRRARRYRKLGFDRALVFSQCSDRPALWAVLSGARERIGLANAQSHAINQRLGWINHRHDFGTKVRHAVQMHLLTAGAPLPAAEIAPLWYAPAPLERAWAEGWRQRHALTSKGYVHLHVGARWATKLWPIAHWAELVGQIDRQFGIPVVVTCGRAAFEVAFARELERQTSSGIYEIGTVTVRQLGALLAEAGAFVGVDSMPMHLAAALQVQGVALFGPTDENVWGPWQSRLLVARQTCSCQGRLRICPDGPQSDCLLQLSPARVLVHLAAMLSKLPR